MDYEIVWLARPCRCPNRSSQEVHEHVAVRARVVKSHGHGLIGFAGEGKALMKAGVEERKGGP